MGSEIANRIKDSEIYGDFVGRDNITVNIAMFQDSEREFVVTHNANIKPTSYFTGRETELQELRQRIGEGRKSVLVSGMGGIGKTHICRKLFEEYLKKHADGGNCPFQHIGYIEYDGDMGSCLQSCLKFQKQDSPEQNQEAAWRELEYLASGGKLLLFVDNVDKAIGADLGLQRLRSIPGAVVLTSRQASFSDEFELYQIDFLDMEQCKEIYEKIRFEDSRRNIDSEEVEDLEYIIENLVGRHTITVELLAHLARTKLWTVKKLRKELEQKGFQLTFRKNGEIVNIQESYEMLYDLSRLTEAEQNVLEAFSVFPYIPLAAETCNKWLLADAGVSEEDDILVGLHQKGWLQFNIEQESYAMHPVFAQFIFDECMPKFERHLELIKACRGCLLIAENGSALECQKFIPFAENIIEKIGMEKNIDQAAFIFCLAYLLQYIAEYKKAEKHYEKFLRNYKDVFGENSPFIARGYNNLADLYMKQGEYEKAKELFEKGFQINNDALGDEHRDTAISLDHLAGVYLSQGEYIKAEEYYKRSLQIRIDVLGEYHLDTAMSYHNLAGLYASLEEYWKAEKLYEKSMRIREKELGENHWETAVNYHNLARVYKEQGKYREAEELYEKSLLICKNTFGENHPNMAIIYDSMALVLFLQKKYKKAKKLYKKCLQIWFMVPGENDRNIARCYNNMAYVYEVDGVYDIALECYIKAYMIFCRKYGLSNPDTLFVLENMKIAYYKRNSEGNFDQWLEEQMKE